MAGGGEAGHVGAGLGDGDVGDSGADPGQGGDQVPDDTKGFDHHLDPGGEVVDGAGVLVDQVQVQPGQEGVVLTEPPGQRLDQFGDLSAQPPLGQLRQLGRVALPGDQRLEHGAAGDAADVGGHRRRLLIVGTSDCILRDNATVPDCTASLSPSIAWTSTLADPIRPFDQRSRQPRKIQSCVAACPPTSW